MADIVTRSTQSNGRKFNRALFVERVFQHIVVGTAEGRIDFLRRLPGRKPHKRDMKASEFYLELPEQGKATLDNIILDDVFAAVASIMRFLDDEIILNDREEKNEMVEFLKDLPVLGHDKTGAQESLCDILKNRYFDYIERL